ncbi:hypothetical protein LVD15_06325 [Fulvivirga maritima]|uniref:hypothetical protein n=1 Tax=Fulvivirga maritima TaxID=2904247 RepID=UPI001F30438A|nr:hypothetical protein [Fulvivirga maritima]UII28038.1 hypothetical protein LVD15_06325 [Fulvivirga maritima]
MMKAIGLALLLVLVTVEFTKAQFDESQLTNLRKVEKYGRLKRTGTAMAVGGGVMTAAGIVLISQADWEDTSGYGSNNNTVTTDDPEGVAGILFTVIGVPLTVTGVVLAIVGHKKEKEYERRLDRVSAGYFRKNGATGITLTYRF